MQGLDAGLISASGPFFVSRKIFKNIFVIQEHFAPSHLVRVIEGETRRAADTPAALPFSLRFFLLK